MRIAILPVCINGEVAFHNELMTCCKPLLTWMILNLLRAMQIEDLSAVAEATNGEVTLANLGPRFTAAAAEPLQ